MNELPHIKFIPGYDIGAAATYVCNQTFVSFAFRSEKHYFAVWFSRMLSRISFVYRSISLRALPAKYCLINRSYQSVDRVN